MQSSDGRARDRRRTPGRNDSVFSRQACAIQVELRNGLNTIPGPLVRSNTGSPTSVGRPAEYKTLPPLVGAGNTWGVVTSVPACSTVPAVAVDGTRPMHFITRLFAWRRSRRSQACGEIAQQASSAELDALIRAHGDWLAFLATILERESVIASDELGRSLSEFASLTSADRPAEGRILSIWAAYLQDTSAALRDTSLRH